MYFSGELQKKQNRHFLKKKQVSKALEKVKNHSG